jgi:hypothetical protein
MEIIKSIKIRKFRSIKSLTKNLNPKDLNVLVGQNDRGKSNVLRALNLFFTGMTDAGTPFRFDDDYCYHSNTGKGTKREIRIDLIIQPPEGRFKSTKPILWTKRWRRDGSESEAKVEAATGKALPATDNVSKWLDKIRYRYVPAIKGSEYFSMLMGELYDVLHESHEHVLKNQGQGFIEGIQEVTEEIALALESQIGIASTIQVPSDFRLLFSSLEFGTEKDGNKYHLKQRGDGIKVRHIPVVLKYMSEQEKNVSRAGYVKPDTIWGFEEPENNLEMRFAFELANEFKKYAKDIQIFVTTHSPAFYALDKTDMDSVNTYLVDQDKAKCTVVQKIEHEEKNSLHEAMGLLPLITPYLEKIYEAQKKIEALTSEAENIDPKAVCIVLTEDAKTSLLTDYLDNHGFNMDETEVISYDGADQLSAALFLGKYLSEQNADVKILIHRDRDYLSDEQVEEIKSRVESKGFLFFITIGVDLEATYLNCSHIAELFKIDAEEAQRHINCATDQAEEKSVSRLIDHWFKNNKPASDAYNKQFKTLDGLYEADKARYRYGKGVCGYLSSILQKEQGQNVNIYQFTQYIQNAQLVKFAEQVWKIE